MKLNRTLMNFAMAAAILVAPVAMVAFSSVGVVNAAAVTVSVTSPADGEFVGTAAEDITFSFAAGAEYASADAITVIVSPALPAALANCGAATTSVGGGTGSFGSFTTTSAVYTFSGASTTATTAASLCLQFPANTPQGSYSIAITDDSSASNYGAALVHAGDNNDVTVTAIIGPTLSFNIRTLDDSADTNVCDMGAVDTTSQPNADAVVNAGEGECGYSLAVATNAAGGFTVTVREQGNFTNGTYNMADQADNAAFAAGTEGYGFAAVAPGATATTEGVAEAGTFATDSSPIPAVNTNFITSTGPVTYTAGTDATDVTAVIHGLAISSSTDTGAYSHVVTYLTTAAF